MIGIQNINALAGVGAPPLDTQLLNMQVQMKSVSLAKWGTHSILHLVNIDLPTSVGAPPLDTQLLFNNTKSAYVYWVLDFFWCKRSKHLPFPMLTINELLDYGWMGLC